MVLHVDGRERIRLRAMNQAAQTLRFIGTAFESSLQIGSKLFSLGHEFKQMHKHRQPKPALTKELPKPALTKKLQLLIVDWPQAKKEVIMFHGT
jgi:hypothetical protein